MVVRRVPITGGHDNGKLLDQPVDRSDHGVAVGDRERPSGTEVVLHVDHDEALHRGPNIVA
jgi:hypothetical protein